MKTTDILRLSLPVPVSVNALYMRTRWGKQIRTKRGREWFTEAEGIIRDEIEKQHWETTDCKVVVEVNTFWRDKRRRDTNNLSKALADALEHAGVYIDDCKALLRYIDYDVDRENPRVDVVVRRFDESKDGWRYDD